MIRKIAYYYDLKYSSLKDKGLDIVYLPWKL
jgi:hypothetical protein